VAGAARRREPLGAGVLRLGLALAAIAAPLQIVAGDLHGLNTLEHQPQKIAAMEGVWETEKGAALRLFAWPDEASRSNRFEIAVPKLGSLILTHSGRRRGQGSERIHRPHPPVAPMFFAFRAMVGVGVLMLAVAWIGAFVYWRARWEPKRLPRRSCSPSPG
jgi:cytochrome d ubiquinol oxidase subunit I